MTVEADVGVASISKRDGLRLPDSCSLGHSVLRDSKRLIGMGLHGASAPKAGSCSSRGGLSFEELLCKPPWANRSRLWSNTRDQILIELVAGCRITASPRLPNLL